MKNGWLHTGDIARTDERGYMFILDRKKDMIVSGGFNIFPREVEDVLSQHADVAMVAVVGVPDEKWGEAVTAVVVAREGARPNGDELIDLVKARKGSAHAPKHIKFVNELPMTGVGKVDKKVLKAGFGPAASGWWGKGFLDPDAVCSVTSPYVRLRFVNMASYRALTAGSSALPRTSSSAASCTLPSNPGACTIAVASCSYAIGSRMNGVR